MTDSQENLNQERKEEIKNSIENETMQSYDINEVRNEVARFEKEVDSHALINYLKEFLRTHNPKFNHLISLFKVLIRSMKKTKEYEVQEIIKYIDNQLERYPEKDNTESYCSIADIYKRLGKVIAVSYLEGKLGDSMSDNDKTIDHINPMLLLSGYYLSAAKDREKAINTIQRAILLFSEKTNSIEYKRLFPLIEGLVPYMKEIKEYNDREIIKFIDKHSRKYPEYDDVKSISKIANLYFVVGKQYGIEYLEDKLVGAKTLIYFDLTIQLSDYYLRLGEGDKAFKSIARANLLVANVNEKFDFLWKQKIIAEKSAEICYYGQKRPMYADFLHYYIVSFILEIARDLVGFPFLYGFFHRKEICYNGTWGLFQDENSGEALKDLNMLECKKDLVNEINNWTFNRLPLCMGIPEKYLKKDVLNILDNLSENRYQWELLQLEEKKFQERPIYEVPIIHKFVAELVKEYYDKSNKANIMNQ
jgi:hypothetical protein